MQNSCGCASDLAYLLNCCPTSVWKRALNLHMLLGGHFCMWWWGAEARSCEPRQQSLASWCQPCLRRRVWENSMCWGPWAWPVMELPVCTAAMLPGPPPQFLPIILRRSRVSEGNFSAVGLHAGFPRVERCLNHDGEKQTVSSTACPLDVFCLTTLSNHFLLSLGFLYFLSLNHKRVFEVCSAPTSALSVLSGRRHGVQY